jgi:tetratricopeptide (TPR) repeat protein
MTVLGDFLIERQQIPEAIRTLNHVLDVYCELFGEDNIGSATTRHFLGNAYARQSKFSIALTQYKMALGIVESNLGVNHIKGAEIMQDLGKAYIAMSRVDEARGFLLRAEEAFKTTFADDHARVCQTRQLLRDIEESCPATGLQVIPFIENKLLRYSETIERFRLPTGRDIVYVLSGYTLCIHTSLWSRIVHRLWS